MNTDSMLLAFENTTNPFAAMRQNQHLFDNGSLIDLPINEEGEELPPQKITGSFSNELHSRDISAYVGLKAKSYIINITDGEDKRKIKGIRYNALHNNKMLTFDDFLDALFNSNEIHVSEYNLIHRNYNTQLKNNIKKRFIMLILNTFIVLIL